MKNTGRNKTIDICKGIGILLVVYNHCSPVILEQFISSFHLPLFFIISGYLCERSNNFNGGKFKDFIFSRFKSLLLPYYIFGLADYIVYSMISPYLFDDPNGVIRQFVFYLLGMRSTEYYYFTGTLWFIAALFSCQLVAYCFLRVPFLKSECGKLAVSIACILICAITKGSYGVFPYNLDVFPFILPFFYFGNIIGMIDFKSYKERIEKSPIFNIMSSVVIFILLYMLTKNNSYLLFFKRFTNIGKWFIGGAVGTVLVMHIAVILNSMKIGTLVARIGLISLEIMAIHQQWIVHFLNVKKLFVDLSAVNSVIRFSITVMSSVVISVIVLFIKRWVRFVLVYISENRGVRL